MRTENDFTAGRILPALLNFSLPILLALLLQAMYGAVDLIIVGKFGQTADISAVSTGSMILQSVTCVIAGLAMGVTVLLGQRIGEGDLVRAGKTVGSGICLFALVAAVLSVGLAAAAGPVSTIMQAPEEAFGRTVSYVRICAMGIVFIIGFNVIGSIFRGMGDAKMPLITVAIACAVNIAGDLLLVAVLQMGAAGAALATIFAQAVSVVLSLLIISRRRLPFSFSRRDVRWDRETVAGILRIGLPIALQEFLVGVSFSVIQAIVNDLGLTQSAGVGVAEKICAFIMLIPSAFMQSMSAFVAQNIGAGKPERARRALWCGIGASLAVSVAVSWLSFFHGDWLAFLFATDRAVILAAADYLRAYAVDCLLTSFLFCFMGYFSGLGRTVFVMLQGILGAFCVRIPVAFLVSRTAGVSLFQIGLATPCSTLVQIVLCLAYDRYLHRLDRIPRR